MQIAIVDTDKLRANLPGERKLGGIVRFDQRRHPKLSRERCERTQLALFQHRGDQQNAIRAGRARFINLVRLENEILAQQRNIHRGADGSQIVQRAFEMYVGQNRDCGGAAGDILARDVGRIESRHDVALARGRALDFGDYRGTPSAQRSDEIARLGRASSLGDDRHRRNYRASSAHFDAFGGVNVVED